MRVRIIILYNSITKKLKPVIVSITTNVPILYASAIIPVYQFIRGKYYTLSDKISADKKFGGKHFPITYNIKKKQM